VKGYDEDIKSSWCKWKYICYVQYYLQYMNLSFLSEFVIAAVGRVWPPPPSTHTASVGRIAALVSLSSHSSKVCFGLL